MLKRLKKKSKSLLSATPGKQNDGSTTEVVVSTTGPGGPESPQSPATVPNGGPMLIGDAYRRDTAEFADTARYSLEPGPTEKSSTSTLPDFMRNPNAVVEDNAAWRHGESPDYSVSHSKYLSERTNSWPPGSLEDLVTNLIKNWKKEATHKARLEDWRTINADDYRFSCNGGRAYTAEEMIELGTSNALIQEAAFYSAKHTSFDESHQIFKRAMPGGFCWEVTEVYSGPPVLAFKWRHWGEMTGDMVCPVAENTFLEAKATGQEVEVWGVCVAHLDTDFRIGKLEVFYDPHDLMASMVDANNISYNLPLLVPDKAEYNLNEGRSMHGYTDGSLGDDGFTTSKGSLNDDEELEILKALAPDRSPERTYLTAKEANFSPLTNGSSSSVWPSPEGSKIMYQDAAAERKAAQPKGAALDEGRTRGLGASSLQTQPYYVPHLHNANMNMQNGVSSLKNGMKAMHTNKAELPSDTALLSALVEHPERGPRISRCPLPHS